MADAFVDTTHGFSTPSDVDHRPWLWAATMLSCIYSLLALAARVTSKWDMLWYDDAILSVAYVRLLAEVTTRFMLTGCRSSQWHIGAPSSARFLRA